MITIAVDAMGGDHGPPVIVPAALQVLAKYSSLCLILVGNRDALLKELKAKRTISASVGSINKYPGFDGSMR